MTTSDTDKQLVRYVLHCGHASEIPADIDAATEGPEPQTPYRWCPTCARWQQVTEKVGADTTTEGE